MRTEHTTITGSARSGDCRLLVSVWNQHRPRPSPCLAWSKHKQSVSVMAFREVHDCEILISETERRPAVYDCSLKEYSDMGLKGRLWGEVCETVVCLWVGPTGRPRETWKRQTLFSLILLIQMRRFTSVCCKMQRRLTLQRKLALAESYDFLVVVKRGQYFFRVCQIPNHSLSYCDQPRGLVVRVSDYWSWGPGFDSRLYRGNFPWRGRFPRWPWSG